MDDEIPMHGAKDLTEQKIQSIEFIKQVEEDFKALRANSVAWEQFCVDFEAIDGMRPI